MVFLVGCDVVCDRVIMNLWIYCSVWCVVGSGGGVWGGGGGGGGEEWWV